MTETAILATKYDQLQAQLNEKQTFIGQLQELIRDIENDCEFIRQEMADVAEQIRS